tara:strand:+ start:511 stop:1179 length:669 start_codon:yes stop_codon:yes gene_type:complete
METNSDYDLFINRITKLNLYLISSSLLLTIFVTITIIFLSPNLAYNSIIILVYLIIFGINYSVTNKIKKQQIVDFARLFEIDIDDNYDELNNTISMYKKGEFEKIEVSFTNKKHRRSRGFDEKGPTSGVLLSPLDKKNQRIDAMSNNDYQDIPEEITAGESLIREADEKYAKMSEQRWKDSETKDTDLIEAGVERLGDLVKTDWFEKNAKDGAIKELYKDKD